MCCAPLWPRVEGAFIYGSLARGTEHAGSDIDLMVIRLRPSNAELLDALLPAQAQLGRAANPTLYKQDEVAQRVRDGKSFMLRALKQPKMMVKGSEHDIVKLGGTGKPGPDR